MKRLVIFDMGDRDARREAEIILAGVLSTKVANGDYLEVVGEPKVMSIVGCARCDGDGHADVEFLPLDYPIPLPDGREAGWWAPCPTNGQPILLAVWDDDGADAADPTLAVVDALAAEGVSSEGIPGQPIP